MGVERRCSLRYAFYVPVLLSYRGHRSFPAWVRDLSLDGMYLETRSLNLPRGSRVNLEFSLVELSWSLTALVAHVASTGVGVVFSKQQPVLYRGVAQLEHAAPRAWYGSRLETF